jgi:hypothetical protein
MTPTQQTKIAELLVNKLKQANKQPYEEILPPSVLQNQIRQQMVMAGVVYEIMKDAYKTGWEDGIAEYDFEHFLNNITK